MAYNEKLADKVRTALTGVAKVEEKRMFRGVTFMLDGKMCISIGDDEMMCRIDPALHETAIMRKGCTTMMRKGREYKGYVLVNEEGRKSKRDFDYWINLSLSFNEKAKASPKKKKLR